MRKLEISLLNGRSPRARWQAVWLAAWVCLSGVMAWAQPANDNFANAQFIFGNSGNAIGSNISATKEFNEPNHAGSSGGASIWYRWTAPSSGTFTFDTFGSGVFDTLLAIYTNNSLNNLSVVASNDDSGLSFTLQSRLQLVAQAGRTYRIAVDSFSPSFDTGTILLNWRPFKPANDDFSSAQIISGTAGTVTGSTIGATKETGEPNHAGNFGGSSVWYQWTAPIGGRVIFDTVGSPYNTLLAVYTGTNVSTLNVVAQDDDSGPNFTSKLTFNAVAGTVYSLAVDGFNATQGTLSLNWTFSSSAGQFIWASDRLIGTTALFRTRDRISQVNDSGLEPNGALVTVTRINGSTGRMLVDWAINGGSAVLGLNYVGPSSGTLAFNDYQMSTNIDLVLLSNFSLTNFFGVTANFTLSNPRPDVANGEDPTLSPSLGAITNAVLTIENSFSGSTPVRFWRANYRGTEGSTVFIRVFRNGSGGATLSTVGPSGFNNGFSLQAGSDYATPTGINADYPFGFFVGVPDPNFNNGPASYLLGIALPDDSEVEFNEDFEIYLYDANGNLVDRATVTIMFDRPTGTSQNISADREQPPGAVDRTHNRDDYTFTSPPFNTVPGANNEVFGVAVQTDQKTVLVGDFTAVNTIIRNRIARLNPDGSLDTAFVTGVGADSRVASVAIQNNQKILLGGGFSSINGTVRGRLARLNTDGSVDVSFNPGTGANDTVWAIAVYSDTNDVANFGKVVVGGEFTQVNSTNRAFIARLNSNGAMDTSFNPGVGPDGPVYSVALQRDAKVIIGGDFTSVDGVPRNRIARLNADGSVDLSFNPGAGADDVVYALALDNSALPLSVNRNATGNDAEDRFSIDTGATSGTLTLNYNFFFIPDSLTVYYEGNAIFSTGFVNTTNGSIQVLIPYGPGNSTVVEIVVNEGSAGIAGTVWNYDVTVNPTVGLQKVYVGGAFATMDLRSRSKIARLNANGSLDTNFDPGGGFNNTVFALATQPDNKPMVGGLFTGYNSTRRVGLARLFLNGSLDTGFMDTAYNQFAGVINPLSVDPPNYLNSLALETNGNLMIGGSFKRVGGGFSRDDIRDRLHVARVIGGSIRGPGNIEFVQENYTVDENAGSLFITLTRTNGSLGPVSATFSTGDYPQGPGAATAGVDYTPLVRTPLWQSIYNFTGFDVMRSDALQGPSNDTFGNPPVHTGEHYVTVTEDVVVNIIDDQLVEGDETLSLTLSQPRSTELLFLGGENIPLGTALGRATSKLTIVDNDFHHGILGFSSPTYSVNEDGIFATVTVSRLTGSNGQVSVNYATSDGTAVGGVSALPGVDYISKSGTLTFNSGITNRTITIQIVNDIIAEADETFFVTLSNPDGGAKLNPALLPTTTQVTIYDDDFAAGKLTFSAPVYSVGEADGFAAITVFRTNGNSGAITVDFATRIGGAVPGLDYVETLTTLSWNDGDTTPRIVHVPIINNAVFSGGGPRSLNLTLSNPLVLATGTAGFPGGITSATLSIIDDDAPGVLSFSSPVYFAAENSGFTTITVKRAGGTAGQVTVDYVVLSSSTATNQVDYILLDGTLTLEDGQTSTNFVVQIIDNATQASGRTNLTVDILLTNAVAAVIGSPGQASLTIVDDESYNIPAGSLDTTFNIKAGAENFIYSLQLQSDNKLIIGGDFTAFNGLTRNRIARLDINGDLDLTFNPGKGANASVRALGVQADRKILLGGLFSTFNGTNRNHIVRLNLDGTVDLNFDPGGGPDNPVYALAVQPDGKVVIGGLFTSVSGTGRNFYARLTTNGVVDTTFNLGLGANGNVYAVALQPDGKVLIGGDFTTVDGQPRARIARLNVNGSVDLSFTNFLSAVNGANESVRALTLQPDGRIVVGGLFTKFNGTPRNYVARLNSDGTLDASFDPGVGGDNVVYNIALQDDGKLVLVGDFTTFSGVSRNRITRLNPDGSMDPSINFGTGANSFVAALAIYPSGIDINKLVVGGGFTSFNGTPRNYLARLHGGAIAGQGKIEFTSPTYSVTEDGGKAIITLRRTGGTADAVTVNFATTNANGTATAGLDYVGTNGSVVFPAGETAQSFSIGIINDILVEENETVRLILSSPSGPSVTPTSLAVGLGDQPVATLTIIDDESVLNFSAASYSVNENVSSHQAIITVTRTGGAYKSVSVQYATSDLSARAGLDYVGVTNTLFFAPGETAKTFGVNIIDDNLVEANETVALRLFNPTGVNVVIGSQQSSLLTIVDNDFAPGIFNFSQANYTVDEAAGTATINILRTNGSTGVVSVRYATSDGSAKVGLDYVAVSGTFSFADGETNKSFTIPIILDSLHETNETVNLTLSIPNPNGGATLGGQSTAKLTIINNDINLHGNFVFSAATFSAAENAGAKSITINRIGGTTGIIGVDFITRNGTAISGKHYTGVTNRMAFAEGQTSTNIFITLLNNTLVDGDKTVNLSLANATGDASVGVPGSAILTILDDDIAPGILGFSAPTFLVGENDTNAVITITRTNGFTGSVSVDFATFNGTALAGTNGDYIGLTNTLIFVAGQTSTNVTILIKDNILQDGNRNLILRLFNATNALGVVDSSLLGLTNALLTILDNETPAGSRDTGFNAGSGANDTVYGLAIRQSDGKLLLVGDFTAFDGVTRTNVARLQVDGTLDTSLNALSVSQNNTNATLRSVAVYDLGVNSGKVMIGGLFDKVGVSGRTNIARLNIDGSVDTTFDAAQGPNGLVLAMAIQNDGRVVIAGAFNQVAGVDRNYIARLNIDGTLDTGFDPGFGPNNQIRALALDDNGGILIGGDFTVVDGVLRNRVARLKVDGSVDKFFDPGTGASDFISAVAVKPDGKIVIGGAFTNVAGFVRNRIAQLEGTGAVDPSFDPLAGANNTVAAIAVQLDGKVIMGGGFSSVGGLPRSRIARLTSEGTNDATINFGTGANNFVAAAVVQPDGKIVIGGGFTVFNGITNNHITRLNGGNNIGAGIFDFSLAAFSVGENAGPATIKVIRTGGTTGSVTVNYATSDGTAFDGIDYTSSSGTLTFGDGVVEQTFTVPITDNVSVDGDRTVMLVLSSPSSGTSLGFTAAATLTILDNDGVIGFSTSAYSVNEYSGSVTITVSRAGGAIGPATVDFATSDGSALAGFDYKGTNGTLSFAANQTSATFTVPIINDTLIEGFESFNLTLTNVTGAAVLGQSTATVTINDDEYNPGILIFSSATYNVNEGATNATITVLRINGTSGAVSADFTTADGTAFAPFHYLATNGTVSFIDGESSKTFQVRIIDDQIVNDGEVINLRLSNPVGATLAGSGAFGDLDPIFNVSGSGPTNVVNALALLPNGKVLIGGSFTSVSGTNRNRIARLNSDGSVDNAFDPGTGANGVVTAIARQPNGQVLVGGNFSSINTNAINRIARLNADGSFDPTFTVGAGANGTIQSIVVQPNGAILIAGTFNSVGGTARNRIARLNFDGTVDASFDPGAGANGAVHAMELQPNGQIVIGGTFTTFSGTNNAARVARLNRDGSYDTNFTASVGGTVNAVSVQTDGKVVIGGSFLTVGSTIINRVARLNVNGSLDSSFNPGTAALGTVNSLLIQPDNNIVVAGAFTMFNGISRNGIERLKPNGTRDTSFDPGAGGSDMINALALQPDTKLIIGGAFTNYNGTNVNFVARLQPGAVFGTPTATLTIDDNDVSLGFTTNSITVAENIPGGLLTLTVVRTNLINQTITADYFTTDGTALGFSDYFPARGTLVFAPGETSKTIDIAIVDDLFVEGNETFSVSLTNNVGASILGLTNITVTIVDNDTNTDVAISMVGSAPPAFVGSNLVYTITVTNNGPSTATGVTVTNVLSPSVTFVSAASTKGVCANVAGTVFCDLGTVTNGTNVIITIIVKPTVLVNITNVAGIMANEPDPVLANNTATVVTGVLVNKAYPSPAGAVITSESISPANGAIDPGETVTVSLSLTNIGNGNTANLVATLLATNGVTAPSGPQTYGVLTTNGPVVTRSFTFTANGTNGGAILATLQLQDGVTNHASAIYVFNLGVATSLSNTNEILLPGLLTAGLTLGPGSPYPSTIAVSNLVGIVNKVTVTLSNIHHAFPDDIDVLLVSPSGESVILMSDTGGGFSVTNLTITLDDDAAFYLPDATLITNNTYKPTDYTTPNEVADSFSLTNTPAGPYATNLSGFKGINPNGTWALYVADDSFLDTGSIAGGWSITITTIVPSNPTAGLAVGVHDSPAPVFVSSNLVYTVTVTNIGPDTATSVLITNLLPSGVTFVSATSTNGTVTVAGSKITCTVPSLAINSVATLNITVIPNSAGTLTNFASAFAGQNDLNVANNTALLVTTVQPDADLSVKVVDSPNPVALGNNVTYTVTITNSGPSTATSVTLVDSLPANVGFVSATPSQGSVTRSGSLVTANLGNLASNATATVTIVVTPTNIGTLTNLASVSSLVIDPNLTNNTATAVTTTVNASADMAIAIIATPNPVVVRSNLVYSIAVTNNGPSMATGVNVTNTLPAGTTFVSANASQGTVANAGGVVSASLGSLGSRASATVTITVSVPSTAGSITNSASVGSATSDPTAANNTTQIVTVVKLRAIDIVGASAVLLTESVLPPNGAVDPGETVSLNFFLRNKGDTATTNLVATLQAVTGVTAPSAPKNYGVLSGGGLAKAMDFTFTASGTNGGIVAATLQLQDGLTDLGTVTFIFKLGLITTYVNTNVITINDNAPATPYPAPIVVSGLIGSVKNVSVTLSNLTHSYPKDIDILLVGPTGQKMILMSDAGGQGGLNNVTFTLDDLAATFLPASTPITAGAYKPANYLNIASDPSTTNDVFAAPAPAGPYGSTLSVFNGTNPNGSWSLYVMDDDVQDSGVISGGWSLQITTVATVNPTAELALGLLASTNSITTANTLTYTIAVTNNGPNSATGVTLTNLLPAGVTIVSVGASQGSITTNGSTLNFALGTLLIGGSANATIVIAPTTTGSITNFAGVTATEIELNATNNTASVVVAVNAPSAAALGGGALTPGKFSLTLTGDVGLTYVIQSSDDLTNWITIETHTMTSSTWNFQDAGTLGLKHRFYRAVKQ